MEVIETAAFERLQRDMEEEKYGNVESCSGSFRLRFVLVRLISIIRFTVHFLSNVVERVLA